MTKKNKMMFTGMAIGALVLIFVPKLYVNIAQRFGKDAEIVTEGV